MWGSGLQAAVGWPRCHEELSWSCCFGWEGIFFFIVCAKAEQPSREKDVEQSMRKLGVFSALCTCLCLPAAPGASGGGSSSCPPAASPWEDAPARMEARPRSHCGGGKGGHSSGNFLPAGSGALKIVRIAFPFPPSQRVNTRGLFTEHLPLRQHPPKYQLWDGSTSFNQGWGWLPFSNVPLHCE